MIAYAKGARTFERHIDIDYEGVPVSPYNSLPHQIDAWFKAWHKAQEMCGASGSTKRIPGHRETSYLDALVRGVYAKRELPVGHLLRRENLVDDIYMAVPLQKGQVSCREIMSGEVLLKAVAKDEPIMIDTIDSPYSGNESLKATIYARGLDPVDHAPINTNPLNPGLAE
jgi:N-acetylneuraminate synthase